MLLKKISLKGGTFRATVIYEWSSFLVYLPIFSANTFKHLPEARSELQDVLCMNVDEAGFPKDRLGHSAVAPAQLLLNLHHTDGQHLQPQEVFVPVQLLRS